MYGPTHTHIQDLFLVNRLRFVASLYWFICLEYSLFFHPLNVHSSICRQTVGVGFHPLAGNLLPFSFPPQRILSNKFIKKTQFIGRLTEQARARTHARLYAYTQSTSKRQSHWIVVYDRKIHANIFYYTIYLFKWNWRLAPEKAVLGCCTNPHGPKATCTIYTYIFHCSYQM